MRATIALKTAIALTFTVLNLISVTQGAAISNPLKCKNINVRKEIRDLTSSEVNNLINAIKKLSTIPSKIDPTRTRYDDFTYIHIEYFKDIHNRPHTWPWHRRFISDFESALQEIDPSVTLPYWNEAYDASSFTNNEVLGPKGLFGSTAGPRNCTKGVFNDFIVNFGPGRRDPKTGIEIPRQIRRCMTRGFFEEDAIAISGDQHMQDLLLSESMNYTVFGNNLDFALHPEPHITIGFGNSFSSPYGDMGGHHSPNDPIFWLHHAYIDYVWYKWQKKSESNLYAYDGPRCGYSSFSSGDPTCFKNGTNEVLMVSSDDSLPSLSGTVRDTLDPASMCFTYQEPIKASSSDMTRSSISSHKASVKSSISFEEFNTFVKKHFGITSNFVSPRILEVMKRFYKSG